MNQNAQTANVGSGAPIRPDELRRQIVAIDALENPALRDAVIRTWVAALGKGGHRSPAEIPQSASCPGRCLLDHVNEVNGLVLDFLGLAETTFELRPDRDTTLAAAILHDVDKSFTLRLMPSGAVEYADGYTVRDHGPAGADLALACGVPDDIAELVRAHAPFNYDCHLPGTVEGTIVHYADLVAADLASVQSGGVPIHARSWILKRDHPLLRGVEVIDAY